MAREGQGGVHLFDTSKAPYQTTYGLKNAIMHTTSYHKNIHPKKSNKWILLARMFKVSRNRKYYKNCSI